jgi:hypothetical protein
MKNSEKMNIQKQYFGSPTGVEVTAFLNLLNFRLITAVIKINWAVFKGKRHAQIIFHRHLLTAYKNLNNFSKFHTEMALSDIKHHKKRQLRVKILLNECYEEFCIKVWILKLSRHCGIFVRIRK